MMQFASTGEQCDRCVARALWLAFKWETNSELTLCGHHMSTLEDTLCASGWSFAELVQAVGA